MGRPTARPESPRRGPARGKARGMTKESAVAAAMAIAALGSVSGARAETASPVTYQCESGRKIVATYGVGDAQGARIAFEGRSFDLYQVRSGSGARYATEQGLSPDHGLQWWVKGDEATLREMIMDHTAPEPAILDTCRAIPAKP